MQIFFKNMERFLGFLIVLHIIVLGVLLSHHITLAYKDFSGVRKTKFLHHNHNHYHENRAGNENNFARHSRQIEIESPSQIATFLDDDDDKSYSRRNTFQDIFQDIFPQKVLPSSVSVVGDVEMRRNSHRTHKRQSDTLISTRNGNNGTPDKSIRHPNRILDKILDGRLHYLNVSDSSSINFAQIIETLRGLRKRRRRSSSVTTSSGSGRLTTVGPSHSGQGQGDKSFFNGTWPLKRVAEMEGDIYLGGLMMVHERGDQRTCGPIQSQGGIQALETMLYTVDKINSDPDFLPFKIGVHILDDCDKDSYGLEQAVDFIKGSISNIEDVDLGAKCADGTPPGIMKNKVISGVVGAASSVTSIQVANLLRLFKIPQVSFFSTSPELSNKIRFETFSRTIPSDKFQVKVMVDIIRLFDWRYVSIIYEESNYGIKAYEELEKLLLEYGICIAVKEKLVKDSGVASREIYDGIVERLKSVSKAKGVIVFGSDQEVKDLMMAVRRRKATGSFTWVGSDGWSARTLVSDGNEAEVEGTLSIQPRANPVQGFSDYFLGLNVHTNTRNPWFIEFWEDHFQCKFHNSSRTPYNIHFQKRCTGNEKLTREDTEFEAQLQYVSDAVMSFAHAFKDMHRELCKNTTAKLCPAMNPVDGAELLKFLRKVEFHGLSGDDFHFDANGDGPARYNIIHFRNSTEGGFKWIRVGKYNEGELTLDMSALQFTGESSTPPKSVCSDPCREGQAKRFVGGDTCCWSCIDCSNDQIRDPINESSCFTCSYGTLPDIKHTVCNPIAEEYLRPTSGWAIGAMGFAGVGIIVTLFVITVFIHFSDTPIVRASGRELSFVLLAGLFSCYSLTFLFVIRPNDLICGVQQFGTGFCFTIVYAALLTKTNRISRIFNSGKTNQRPSFISPQSQLVICSMLVLVQVLVNLIWMLFQPPKAIYFYPTRADNLLVCNSYIHASYTIAFAYPIILIIICTVYAVLTRKIPEAFNESKYIGFTMYTTCIIWLAFVPIYFSTANQLTLRITSMSMAISMSATVMICCLFTPKLYIILFHPERNVRQSMMTTTRHSTAPSAASAIGGGTISGGGNIVVNPAGSVQMTQMKNNHLENSPIATMKDSATQFDEDEVDFQPERKLKSKNSSDKIQAEDDDEESQSFLKKSTTPSPPATTSTTIVKQNKSIETQTQNEIEEEPNNIILESKEIIQCSKVEQISASPSTTSSSGAEAAQKEKEIANFPLPKSNCENNDSAEQPSPALSHRLILNLKREEFFKQNNNSKANNSNSNICSNTNTTDQNQDSHSVNSQENEIIL